MSLTRTKLANRSNGKSDKVVIEPRPRQSLCSQKSYIPKCRSLSQPPSIHTMKQITAIGDNDIINTTSNLCAKSGIGIEELTADHSVKSDEFKDCLDNVKGDDRNSSSTDNNIEVSESNMTDINERIPRDVLSRRNSASGIPISLTGPASKVSPRPSPRLNSSTRKFSNLNESRNVIQSKKNMEMFIMKKRRFDLLKKDLIEKQKPFFDLYQNLQQLKTRLNDSGKEVPLDSIALLDCEELYSKLKFDQDLSGIGESVIRKVDLDPALLRNMKISIKEIPTSFIEVYKGLNEKTTNLFTLLENVNNPDWNKEDFVEGIERFKIETLTFEASLQNITEEQEKVIDNLVEKWSQLVTDANDTDIQDLQANLKKLEAHLKEVVTELNITKLQLKEKPVDTSTADEIAKLKDKINLLEKQAETDKKKYAHEVDRYRVAEQSVKSFKTKVKEFDHLKQQQETKIAQLSQDLKNSLVKIKQLEKNYDKEITELNKSRHLDKMVIEKLNKDKATFETRLSTLTTSSEEAQTAALEEHARLTEELVKAKNIADISKLQLKEQQVEMETLRKEIVTLQTQTQQTNEALQSQSKGKDVNKPTTDKECELQIEGVALRTTIRALQHKMDEYMHEKIRFITTIEKISEGTTDNKRGLIKALVDKDEEITNYQQYIQSNEDKLSQQELEIETLKSDITLLKEQLDCNFGELTDDELKRKLIEGKAKLDHAVSKTIENERKILKYEHELGQKNQQIANLENLMKVRDGLIGVIKAKKDELSMENNSLTKYSEDIRTYVLQSREEVKEKSEIIHELQSSIDFKQKESYKLEKKIRDLEEKLAMTNQKRYKLQDTVSVMEKELQASKARINRFEDVPTRYAPGRISHNSVASNIGLQPWKKSSEKMYSEYKAEYEKNKRRENSIMSQNHFENNSPQSASDYCEEFPSKLETNVGGIVINNTLYTSSADYLDEYAQPYYGHPFEITDENDFVPEHNQTWHIKPHNRVFNCKYPGLDNCVIANNGDISYSDDIQLNHKQLIAQSCSKMKENLEASYKLLNEQNFYQN